MLMMQRELNNVHCGSIEVIYCQVQQSNKKWVSNEKCQRKTESSILTWSKPQCLVRLQVIFVPEEFLFKEAIQHQTRENIRENHGNSREAF